MWLNVLLLIIPVSSLNRRFQDQMMNNVGKDTQTIVTFSSKVRNKDMGYRFPLHKNYGQTNSSTDGISEDDLSHTRADFILSATEAVTPSTLLVAPEQKPDPLYLRHREGDSRKIVHRHKATKFDDNGYLFTLKLLGVIIGVIALILLICLILCLIKRRRRLAKLKSKEKVLMLKQPRKMESEDLNRVKFSAAGPLVLDRKLEGPVKHALDDENSQILQGIEFDFRQNEIVDIGSNIELIGNEASNTEHTTEASKVSQAVPTTKVRKAASAPNIVGKRVRKTLSKNGKRPHARRKESRKTY